MDRYTLRYQNGQPVAIQDRLSTFVLNVDELDTICDILNEAHLSQQETLKAWNKERESLHASLGELGREYDRLVSNYEEKISVLEDEISFFRYVLNTVDPVQPQHAPA